MRVFIAIVICKILYFIGSLRGRGSSLPGQIALKACPGVLKRIKLPKTIIAVTGSNGKTSTTELIARALEANGLSVGWNHEGSNQIEGAATLLLRLATFGGAVKRDALVLECDERYARYIFEDIKPGILVVTNLCRDQLTRNGHPEFIYDCIRAAIDNCQADAGGSSRSGFTLVLNADDPYVAALAEADNTVWFGAGQNIADRSARGGSPGIYDDGAFCPVCKSRMTYGYRIAGHYGAFRCGTCGHSRQNPDVEITSLDTLTGETTISNITIKQRFPSLTGAYNLAAAIAAASAALATLKPAAASVASGALKPAAASVALPAPALGAGLEKVAQSLDNCDLKGGRTVRFTANGREGLLLVSKHENSLSYNQSMTWIAEQQRPCAVIIMVDSISRKYYTSETSWLWDIDFDILSADNVREILLAGRYSNELMARFAMTAIDPDKYRPVADNAALHESVAKCESNQVYALTCFSDKAKLLNVFNKPDKRLPAELKPRIPDAPCAVDAPRAVDAPCAAYTPRAADAPRAAEAPDVTDAADAWENHPPGFRILHLCNDLMNLYGDWANAEILARELMARGYAAVVEGKSVGDDVDFSDYDFVYIGSGTERSQRACMKCLAQYKETLVERIEAGMHVLATGNSHELFGKFVTGSDGKRYETIGLLDFETVQRNTRLSGDCVTKVLFLPEKLIGFVNRAGEGQEGDIARPFLQEMGPGANDRSGAEGIQYKNLLGTYMTGPILLRNPPLLKHIADKLVERRRTCFPGTQSSDTLFFYLEVAYKMALTELSARLENN